jgi:hypothetical protein
MLQMQKRMDNLVLTVGNQQSSNQSIPLKPLGVKVSNPIPPRAATVSNPIPPPTAPVAAQREWDRNKSYPVANPVPIVKPAPEVKSTPEIKKAPVVKPEQVVKPAPIPAFKPGSAPVSEHKSNGHVTQDARNFDGYA